MMVEAFNFGSSFYAAIRTPLFLFPCIDLIGQSNHGIGSTASRTCISATPSYPFVAEPRAKGANLKVEMRCSTSAVDWKLIACLRKRISSSRDNESLLDREHGSMIGVIGFGAFQPLTYHLLQTHVCVQRLCCSRTM